MSHDGGDFDVVIDHLSLGESRLWVKHLLEIAYRDGDAVDFQFRLFCQWLAANRSGLGPRKGASFVPPATGLPWVIAAVTLRTAPCRSGRGCVCRIWIAGGVHLFNAGEHDRLDIGGKALFAGRIVASFTSGFRPLIGNRFEIVSYRSELGAPALADITQSLDLDMGATGLTLVTQREPIIIEPFALAITPIAEQQVKLVLTGQAGQAYTVEGSTDLVNWNEVFSTESAANDTIELVDAPEENIDHQVYRASAP